MNRCQFIASTALSACLPALGFAAETKPVFPQRGYYLCLMRMPTFGLAVWKERRFDVANIRAGVNKARAIATPC